MKKIVFILAAINILSVYAEMFPLGDNWKFEYEKNNITIFSKSESGSKLMAFMAKGLINAPIKKIMYVLRDVENTPIWNLYLVEKRTIEDVSDDEAITYNHNKLPWPMKDRDLVLNNKLHMDPDGKFLVVKSYSVTHPSHPPTSNKIRAHISYGLFKFRPVNDETTYFEMMVHIDPKGKIPKWIVNTIQLRWPYKFIKSLEKRSNEIGEVKLNKGLQKQLEQLYQVMSVAEN